MTPTTTDLPPELVTQVRGLTPDQRDRLRDQLDELDEADLPPVKDIDWTAEIKRRMDDHAANPSAALTREQAAAQARAEMRKLGLEPS